MTFKKAILFSILIFLTTVWAQDAFQDRLLIALKPEAPSLPTGKVSATTAANNSQLQLLLQKYHVVKIEKWLKSADQNDVFEGIDFNKVYRFYFEKSSLLKQAAGAFKTAEDIIAVDFEPKVKIAVPIPPAVTSDPFVERQYYLDKIMAKYAWTLLEKVSPPAQPILIGIVDTGIDYLHPEMEPVLYINPGEDVDGDGQFTSADLNGIDDDGNGFVDDVRGWDFSYASDSVAGDNDIRPPSAGGYEILSHGTHVAGIAGAMANNGLGISGIARGYKIIGTKHSLDDDLSNGYLYNAYDGILYCAKLGADVVNCSWGGSGYYDLAQKLIDMVRKNYGTIVVAAAGNDNNNNDNKHFYPSDLDGVISVAALGPDDRKASFSNFGHVIDISAPGVGIFSTIHYYKGGYATWQGTSMASPVVAGSIALVKYFFPDLSPDELVQKVLDAADPLNEINPSYRNLLGSGRVNVYNAIGPSFLPDLHIIADSLQFEDLNGNGQMDPGEKIELGLKLANSAGWQRAQNLQVVVSSSDSLLHLIDSSAFIGTLEPGQEFRTDLDDFIILPDSNHVYGTIRLTFTIKGFTDEELAFRETFEKEILLSMFQPPFPQKAQVSNLPVSIMTAPDNNSKRLVFIDMNNQLNVMDATGQVLPPFPIDLQEFHRVPQVIADVDNDGQQEIATLSNYGKLKVFKQDGTVLLDLDLNEVVYGNFAVDDLNGDGQLEFVIGTMKKKLHVLSLNGNELDGFPLILNAYVAKGLAIGDINDDGFKEIVLGTFDKKVHVIDYQGNELNRWPKTLAYSVKFPPVIGKDKKGVLIAVLDQKNQLIIFSEKGAEQLTVPLREKINFAPFLMDLNKDGLVEVTVIDEKNYLIALNSAYQRYYKALGSEVNSNPLIFASDGEQRLITLKSEGEVSVFTENLKPRNYSPVQLPLALNRYCTLGDLDNDGDLEVIANSSDELIVLDLPEKAETENYWSTYLANEQRTSFLAIDPNPQTGLEAEKILPYKIQLQTFPNPFNSTVKISITANGPLHGKLRSVKIYDIRGRLVKELLNESTANLPVRLTWNGENMNRQQVSSGLYFVQIQIDDQIHLVKKIAFVK